MYNCSGFILHKFLKIFHEIIKQKYKKDTHI